MEFFDCHCHTERSDCTEDVTLEMYVEIAGREDCVFAITDHSAQVFYPPDNPWGFWGDGAEESFERHYEAGLARCEEYVEWVLGERTGGMLVGIELDVLPDGRMVFDPSLLPELEFVLGAVHGIRGLTHELPLDEVIDEYKFRTLRLCEFGVNALAHPFREWKIKQRDVPPDLIAWLVQTASETGVAIELNSHYTVPEYDVPMVRLCAEVGVPIAIATDTHASHEFGNFAYHEQVLCEAGVTESEQSDVLLPAPVPGPWT